MAITSIKWKQIVLKIVAALLLIVSAVLLFQKRKAEKEAFQANTELRRSRIAQDSLVKLSDGFYQKYVADTLTQSQLKKLAADIIELKNRKPVSITTTVIKPVEVIKPTDQVVVENDSLFIEDFYPKKENPFLTYTNRLSLTSKQGVSKFKFNLVTLEQVVTKKEDGLYQVDFKGPEFLELQSLDIQTTPLTVEKDNWGTVIGGEYGKNFQTDQNIYELSVYERYKKFYFGGSVSSDSRAKVGLKWEF